MNVAELEGLATGATLMNGMDEAEAITYLARRVIAAEMLIDSFEDYTDYCDPPDYHDKDHLAFEYAEARVVSARQAYEATK